jgi:hypothetical protein
MVLAEIGDHHFHAGVDECDCHAAAYTASASGYKSDLSFDVMHDSTLLITASLMIVLKWNQRKNGKSGST